MATVRERAAALNLSEKLCLRPPVHGMASKPFQASIWSSIIANLRSSVKVKKRRIHLKSHSDCFLGSDAVDVVSDHILHCRFFARADISRDKVARVCQALLDCRVFERVDTTVFGKDEKRQHVFHDSRSCLYRFLNTESPTVDELENGVLNPGIQSTFCCRPEPCGQEEQILTQVTPVKSNQPLASLMEGMSLTPSGGQANSKLPQSLVDEVWQEQTFLRLLQLLELPLLDGLLEGRADASPPRLANSNPDLIYTSNYLDREVLRAFKDSQEDAWLTAALDCLDFLPDQQVVLVSQELPRCAGAEVGVSCDEPPSCTGVLDVVTEGFPRCQGMAQCKLLLYETLLKHYSHPDRPPLLPSHMSDVCTGVTNLLVNGRLDRALEALQLCLKLLHPQRREELRRLLCFMVLAADALEMRLDNEVENKLVVKRAFSRAIIHTKTLSKEKTDLVVLFLMGNRQDIFKIPGALHKLVSDKLASLVQGKQPDVTGSTFCQRISTEAYEASTTTNKELCTLLKDIHEDPKHSAKEKKRLLGQFYKGHPEIFVQYFGDSVSDLF